MKKVVIVESPSKSKTIESYLGDDYIVVSSLGHVRDLAIKGEGGLGIDINNKFKPNYVILDEKKKVVDNLKKVCKNNQVYLATDPDREGEAISWHLSQILDIDLNENNRVVFNEITKDAVLNGIKNSRKLDMNLVYSQETRRILDRIIGFKLSTLLQNKIGSKSAGRVQSVALKLIVDLEDEIKSFLPEKYYNIEAEFPFFKANLINEKEEIIDFKNIDEVNNVIKSLSLNYYVKSITYKQTKRDSKGAYVTSTLQQDASTKLNFDSIKTMRIAQALYEGKTIKDELVGLITYMRTDSERLSEQFINSSKKYIKDFYGEEYVGKTKVKKHNLSQDAHEAIRPTSIYRTPDSIKDYLTKDELKLYKLIYNRALASLMAPAKYESQKVILENNSYNFKINNSKLIFDGYLKVYTNDEKEELNDFILINENTNIVAINNKYIEKETKPKSRYTEAKLIKDMEELGIGRPSTYAQTIKTLKDRKYISVVEKKFVPTELGIITTQKLEEFFKKIISVDFTRRLELKLDDIATGNENYYNMVSKFYYYFIPLVEKATKEMEKKKPKELDETCELCGSKLVLRTGKYGEFKACSNYPKCKYIKKEKKEVSYLENAYCPNCNGKLVLRIASKGKNKGKKFYSCENFPKCKYILEENGETKR